MTNKRTYLSLAITGISKRNIVILAIFICLFFLSSLTYAQDISQVVLNLEEILKANPLEPGATNAKITKFEDDTATVLVIQNVVGMVLKPHYHKSHSETIYVVKGSGQIFSNDKWVDVKPGSLHFNPMGKVHGIKNTGNEPLVVISVFAPALKEPDRHFVE
jgi:mannose-6-phosphate isomerase-like protein (cupin superfamily)